MNHATDWIRSTQPNLPPVPRDLLDAIRGALPRHYRLMVGMWLFGDRTRAGELHAARYVLRLYERSGDPDAINRPLRRSTVAAIVGEIDELVG